MKRERVYDHFCQVVFLIILLVSGCFFFQSLDDNFFFRCFSRWSTPFVLCSDWQPRAEFLSFPFLYQIVNFGLLLHFLIGMHKVKSFCLLNRLSRLIRASTCVLGGRFKELDPLVLIFKKRMIGKSD